MHHNSSHEWEQAVKTHMEAINAGFEVPLPHSEVKATAKSIAKWVWQRFSYGDFSEIQAKRGAKGGKKGGIVRSAQYAELRIQAKLMHEQGMSIKVISETLEVHRNSISAWIR